MTFLEKIKGKLVVSCQALPEEPLHSSYIMSKMARAAKEGGANGIRANSAEDIEAIKAEVSLPVVGIVKRDYEDSEIYITATLKEIKELLAVNVDMIAIDATSRKRPGDVSLKTLVDFVKKESPTTQLMADISTLEEARQAEKLGFDCVSTTLVGYTPYTEGLSLFDNDFALIKEMNDQLAIPVVAEGKLNTPKLAKEAVQAGADLVVVGSAITRPQLITASFSEMIK